MFAVVVALMCGTAVSGEPMKRDMVLFRDVGMAANITGDLAFKVYDTIGDLPED